MEPIDRILELAKKIKALSERGVGGERENAIVMLQRLMKNHEITMDMINENDAKDHVFVIIKDRKRFFFQVIANVAGKNVKYGQYVKAPRGKLRYFINCTASEAIEIQAKFDFFYTAYEKEVDIFYSAFIQKNNLYSKPTGEEREDDDKELTTEESERLSLMMNMMQGMKRHIFTKQLN